MNVGLILVVALLALVVATIVNGVKIVPQGFEFVIMRLGKYHVTLTPGLNLIIPYIDTIAAKVTRKDISLEIPSQEVITRDNAVIITNAIAFINIHTPHKAIFGIDNYEHATSNLIMTNLRAIVGQMDLDDALSSREQIKVKLIQAIATDLEDWGLTVKSIEIQDIKPSTTMQASMERQAAAERIRRAAITEAEGEKQAAILIAEGQKQKAILVAEGSLEASRRDAEARIVLANATKDALALVQQGLGSEQLPALYLLGEKYIATLQQLGTSDNAKTVILPADLPAALQGMFGMKMK
ncbi:MAG: SPFH/Band 7/PHB domain protein [Desulfobulbaceae bacterium]|jgi:regulator of protease activity HflC (stomatin/prohibitin superfamily)|nr:SPFH/Band 7/PHB domain protein [Desulfobulbaceae bacterium]